MMKPRPKCHLRGRQKPRSQFMNPLSHGASCCVCYHDSSIPCHYPQGGPADIMDLCIYQPSWLKAMSKHTQRLHLEASPYLTPVRLWSLYSLPLSMRRELSGFSPVCIVSQAASYDVHIDGEGENMTNCKPTPFTASPSTTAHGSRTALPHLPCEAPAKTLLFGTAHQIFRSGTFSTDQL